MFVFQFNMPNVTIGCGIVVPPGAVFFTVDGRPLSKFTLLSPKEIGKLCTLYVAETWLLFGTHFSSDWFKTWELPCNLGLPLGLTA